MNSKNADGTTATNYYTTDGGAAAAAAKNNITITAANAKDATKGFIQQFDVNGNLSFNLHVGADSSSDNKIKVEIASMDSKGIGIKNIKAQESIPVHDFVTTERKFVTKSVWLQII